MTPLLSPHDIIKKMYDNDAYSKWLGISIEKIEKGSCQLKMEVREDMTNGFSMAHGGITYALADSALAFASNSLGRQAVSIETSISHTRPIFVNDVLTAKTIQKNLSTTLGIYDVEITNQDGKIVALFKGTVFRKSENWK